MNIAAVTFQALATKNCKCWVSSPSITQSSKQSINQVKSSTVNQSIKSSQGQPINQSIKWSQAQSINQSINQVKWSQGQPINQSINQVKLRTANQSINQSKSGSIKADHSVKRQSINQSINQWCPLTINRNLFLFSRCVIQRTPRWLWPNRWASLENFHFTRKKWMDALTFRVSADTFAAPG